MSYYVREVQSGHHQDLEIWNITEDDAIRLGTNKQGLWHYVRESGETIWDAIRRLGAWERPDGSLPVHELKIAPGHYFPRIARNIIPEPQSFALSCPGWQPSLIGNENAVASARVQLSTLVRQLERVCETVHPEKRNLDAYGYDIRNLLILACTEVESHWRAVLKANGVTKSRCTTDDYFGLTAAMKLKEYSISFPDYPWIEPVVPFGKWDKSNPTATLGWYEAYNGTKHDRENNLEKATLRCAFDAVAGCAIMIVAQFGEVFGFKLPTAGRPRTFFWIHSGPVWDLAECYVENLEIGSAGWTPVNHPFSGRQPRARAQT